MGVGRSVVNALHGPIRPIHWITSLSTNSGVLHLHHLLYPRNRTRPHAPRRLPRLLKPLSPPVEFRLARADPLSMNDGTQRLDVSGRAAEVSPFANWPSDPVDRLGLRCAKAGWMYLYGLHTCVQTLVDLGSASDNGHATHDAMCEWHDRTNWPTRTLRIGLHNPSSWADAIVRAESCVESEFYVVPASTHPTRACAAHNLDAIITYQGEDSYDILANEHPSREAAWYDWTTERPLSYASVFPTRVDCGRITLPANEDGAPAASILRSLLDAAAMLARHPARLGFRDRLNGRRPAIVRANRSDRFRPFTPSREYIAPAMLALAAQLESAPFSATPTSALRAAAHACGAWLTSSTGPLQDDQRRNDLERVARVTGDEPQTMLRLAAARFAVVDDSAGMEAMLRAQHVLHAQGLPEFDQSAFLQSELEHGVCAPIALGRVASGIALVCASLSNDKIPYFRDDVMDDARYSGWLVGRDQDRKFLLEVFDAIIRDRASVPQRVRQAA